MIGKWAALAILVLAPVAAAASEPFASDWVPSAKSRARLIADGAGQAGVEVELATGAITYWRDPGDAGVPPIFDFSGSTNLAHAEAAYPAPERISESDGSQAFGYERGLVFPIRVAALDPGRAVDLAVKLDYAVCEKICLPARAAFELRLPTGVTTPFAGAIAAAFALVPKPVDAKSLGLELTALGSRDWRLCWPDATGGTHDLFVEPPPGWWLTATQAALSPGRDCFALSLRDAPADAAFPASVRATIISPAGAVETLLTLFAKP